VLGALGGKKSSRQVRENSGLGVFATPQSGIERCARHRRLQKDGASPSFALSLLVMLPHSRLARFVRSAALTASLLLAAAAPLHAVTTTLSGAINASSPSFVRPTGGTADGNLVLSPPFNAGTTSYKYFTQTITPSATGAYDITVTGTTGDTDPYLFVYSPSFSDTAPLTNALVANDDQPGRGLFSKIPALNLTAGTTYVIVATFYNAAATGTITLDLVGPGTVAISGGPTVSGVTSSTANASYAGGSAISIQVSFSAAVTVTGTPTLALNTTPARSASYASGSGASTLTFTYIVQPGDASADLDYASTGALTATGGATITNTTGTSATLTLPAPGATGSLGNAKNIVIASTSGTPAAYAWGDNSSGKLATGNANTAKLPAAVTVTGALAGKTVTAIAVGNQHTLFLTSDGRVYAAGSNSTGQLGNNSTTSSNAPVAVDISGVLAGKTVSKIAAGGFSSLALTSDGLLVAWGRNRFCELGNGSKTDSKVPVAVTASGALAGKTITAIAAGQAHAAALGSDGRVYVWGGG
jgi:hypothetical protein